jgi:cytidine deaminase
MMDDRISRRVALGVLGTSCVAQHVNADDIVGMLPAARAFSIAPISNYHVGAVVRGSSGRLYLGANLEIAGQPLGFAVHAEQAATSQVYMAEEKGIAAIAVTAAPCGHCRQFLEELSPDGEIEVLMPGQAPIHLKSLLPSAFGPKNLGFTQGAFPVKRVKMALTKKDAGPLAAAALDAACMAYAPYTKAYSGVAIAMKDGSIHKGAYIENAAFNPSLPPLQVALVSAIVAKRALEDIVEVVLVELDRGTISQMAAAEAVISSVRLTVRIQHELANML